MCSSISAGDEEDSVTSHLKSLNFLLTDKAKQSLIHLPQPISSVDQSINIGLFVTRDECHWERLCSVEVLNHYFGSVMEVLKTALENVDAQHPEVFKPQLLRSLYAGLVCLSQDSPFSPNSRSSDYFVMGSLQFDWNVKFNDILNLSNFLFKELSRRFNQFFSDLGVFPVNTAFGKGSLNSVTWEPPQGLLLLLRCCMVILHLLEFNPALLWEKCQTILTILSRLCSPELISHMSCNKRGSGKSEDGVTFVVQESEAFMSYNEQSGSPIPFLCSIFEVFIDELLSHRQLRQYFMMIDTVSSTSEKLFMCHLSHGDTDAVLELISVHFLLSFSDDPSFKNSLDALSGWHSEEPPFLELSLTGAVQLLGTSTIFSAPLILRAHIISFVARCIGIDMSLDYQRLKPGLVNCYISSFERSIILYCRHMLSLQLGGHFEEPQSKPASFGKLFTSREGSSPSFESYVRPITYNLINVQVTKFADSSSHLFSMKPDLVSACITYMNENQYILDKAHKDEILSILKCIIMRTLSGGFEAALLLKGDISRQEMYLLASIMKLMSSSLLQTIWCMQTGSLGCRKILKDYSQCQEYDFIVGIISSFRQYSINQPIEGLLLDVMVAYPTRHSESKLMLMHFAGLLLFSFKSGLEFLCEGCIFMMMTLMNLFIFEEGNLDALKALLGSTKEAFSSNKSSMVPVVRSSSWMIASKFQKSQTFNYLRTDPLLLAQTHSENPTDALLLAQTHSENPTDALLIKNVDESAVNIVDDIMHSEESAINIVEENLCSGEMFIKCVYGEKDLSKFDDLADFIVCTEGKDYSDWAKGRLKYRKFKTKKMVVLKQERKRRSLGLLKGTNTAGLKHR